ncbi:MAG: TIGR00282 family metallophosphoesterase [Lactimicrobium massiliense]|nr:TIGR00282 family metallophosphoesterase [Lactimicrobium massiliense]MDD6675135.1 TIGR00282 family metallophosphoesterase [Lactimicrobium massiliense]
MKILFLGDIVAQSGVSAVCASTPLLQAQYHPDFIIANGENAADGKGMTRELYTRLKAAGIDVITLGNHAFSKRAFLQDAEDCPDIIWPANIGSYAPQRPVLIRIVKEKRVAVLNILGNVFMNADYEDPILVTKKIMNHISADIILIDFHAEATSEKSIYFQYFKDRVTAMIGTHTHVQTADEKVENGCAFISDVGMCGPYDSVLGRDRNEAMDHAITGCSHYRPSDKEAVVCGAMIDIDDHTNRAVSIERIQLRPGSND